MGPLPTTPIRGNPLNTTGAPIQAQAVNTMVPTIRNGPDARDSEGENPET
jgi:hypothetical protein